MTTAHFGKAGAATDDADDTLQRRLALLQAGLVANMKRGRSPTLALGMAVPPGTKHEKPVLYITVFDPATDSYTQHTADFVRGCDFVGARGTDNTVYLRLRGTNRFINFTTMAPAGPAFMAAFIDADLTDWENNRNKPRYRPFVPPEFNSGGCG